MRMCPYLDDPDSDCYCMNLNSQTVESVIHYCGGMFKECEFFRRREEAFNREAPERVESGSLAEGSRSYPRGR